MVLSNVYNTSCIMLKCFVRPNTVFYTSCSSSCFGHLKRRSNKQSNEQYVGMLQGAQHSKQHHTTAMAMQMTNSQGP